MARFTCELDAERLRDIWYAKANDVMQSSASISFKVAKAHEMLTIAKELDDFALETLERNVKRYDPNY